MKRLLLLTVPHSGTHTWFRLLSHIGGLPIWYSHFDRQSWALLERALSDRDTLFLVAKRQGDALVETYARRATKKSMTEKSVFAYMEECIDIQNKFIDRCLQQNHKLVEVFTDGPPEERLGVTRYVTARFGRTPTEEMFKFLAEWPRLNAYHPDRHTRPDYQPAMHDRHITKMFLEEDDNA